MFLKKYFKLVIVLALCFMTLEPVSYCSDLSDELSLDFDELSPVDSVSEDETEETEDSEELDGLSFELHVSKCDSIELEGEDPDMPLECKLNQLNELLRQNRCCRRIYGNYAIVGDIHGDIATFKELIGKLSELIDKGSISGVVFLGDFWDRMPGDTEVFERLIDFMYKYNLEDSTKVIVLCGNHETYEYRMSQGSSYPRYLGKKTEVVKQCVDLFYMLLPFNVIINDCVYAVHGGLPYSGDKMFEDGEIDRCILRLLSESSELYPVAPVSFPQKGFDLVYSSVWSDFDSTIGWRPVYNSWRMGEITPIPTEDLRSCLFGRAYVKFFLDKIKDIYPKLNIKTVIAGHYHTPRFTSFISYGCGRSTLNMDEYKFVRVITSPNLCLDHGTVCMVDKSGKVTDGGHIYYK